MAVYIKKTKELCEMKLEAIEYLLKIKFNVMNDLEPSYYVENLDKVMKLEEDYVKLLYKYYEMKEKFLFVQEQ